MTHILSITTSPILFSFNLCPLWYKLLPQFLERRKDIKTSGGDRHNSIKHGHLAVSGFVAWKTFSAQGK